MHPHDAERFDAAAGARIEELLHDPRVVGVGECGLDYFRMHSPEDDQVRALRRTSRCRTRSGKPMVVHVRDAWPDVLRVLDEGSAERVVIHCFSGDADDRARVRGARLLHRASPATSRIRRTSTSGRRPRAVPIDGSLVETDAPFLAPQKMRGTDNEPANVMITLAAIARVRGDDVEKSSPRRRRTRARRSPDCGDAPAGRNLGTGTRIEHVFVLKFAVRVEGLLAVLLPCT